MNNVLPYNPESKQSILNHALQLLGKSLRQVYPHINASFDGKGSLGQAVEKYHFLYDINNESHPDFEKAGVELKCTPLKIIKDGSMVSKERLVLNIINYVEEADKTFYNSSFWKKNELLLLIFYLHETDKDYLDFLFKIIRLWQIPKCDIKIFMDDWNKIHKKIISGHAHELSEGDTFYLGACIKGSKGKQNKRKQPFSDILADQRAYSIKSSYLNSIIMESANDPNCSSNLYISEKQRLRQKTSRDKIDSVVKDISDYKRGESFEQLIERRFKPFYGKTIHEIEDTLGVEVSNSPKAVSFSLCKAILGVKTSKISEFEKAGIQMKTIRLQENGGLKEAMSFPCIKWTEIVNEDEWESSAWYKMLTQRFLFVVFRKHGKGNDKDATLEKTFFWTMPNTDLAQAKIFWADTRDKVRRGEYNSFISSIQHPICHVRPHARDSHDLMKTPQGTYEKKKCYWLNRNYILNIIKEQTINQ